MTRFASLAAIVVAGSAASCLLGPQPLTLTKVADNLFVISDGYHSGNTAVLVRGEGVVLVDTKGAGDGQRILDLIKSVTDKPVTHILNTHTHEDHVGGNAFFAQHVEVIAHERTAARMTDMNEFRESTTKHGLPDRTFKDTLPLFSGSDAIEMYYFGAAHTDGDAFIVFRGLGVMHAGDTFPGVNPADSTGGSAQEYPKTMSRAVAGIAGVHTVIPGHAPVTTWQAFVDDVARMNKRQ